MSEEQYVVFTGNPTDTSIKLIWNDILIEEGGQKWVKKKVENNCLSLNPEDCMVWCLVELPQKRLQFYSPLDTSTTDQYLRTQVPISQMILKSKKESTEVICAEDVYLWQEQVSEFLIESSYLSENWQVISPYTEPFQRALLNYQIDNRLCTNGLTLETLREMRLIF